MSIKDLMQIAADYNQKRIVLSDDEKKFLITLLKERALEQLEYGEEIECETVRLVRRVTGAVSIFFT